MLNRQAIPAILLGLLLLGLVPLSHKNVVMNGERSTTAQSVRPKKAKQAEREDALVVNGVRYDGFQKYAYIEEAFKRGQLDLSKPPKYPRYKPGYIADELSKSLQNSAAARTKSTAVFTERGPSNIPGRTRAIVIDAADPTENTWFAGSVGGGIWKTMDGGLTWLELTADLPNIAISTMAQSQSNPEVLYAGTGERIFALFRTGSGNGIMKSTDGGLTWAFLPSTSTMEFENIGRIIVDPADENVLLASTSSYRFNYDEPADNYIFRSEDGGASWTMVFQSEHSIPHIIADPKDFDIQYATVYNGTIVKSTDGGRSWSDNIQISKTVLDSQTGIFNQLENPGIGRIELAIAPQNTDIIYASLDVGGSSLHVSLDGGLTWNSVKETNSGRVIDWLVQQGSWDNTVLVSPLNDSIVYLGGVGIESFRLDGNTSSETAKTIDFELQNTSEIIEIWNLFADEGTEITEDDFVSVEIRFGVKQQAHRFTVPEGSTSGVPAEDYAYQGYVEVPFQVWDVDNGQQLMVSFRDNNRNGVFDLNDDFNSSREYIFVNNIPYVIRPDENIDQAGGYQYKNSFLLWLVTPDGVSWSEEALTDVTIRLALEDEVIESVSGEYTLVANPYEFNPGAGGYVGPNDLFELHPDHHQMFAINIDATGFSILNTNDGGVWLSDKAETPGIEDASWTLRSAGYNTTTYYGADKSPTEDRYFAGAQDQGTHISPAGEVATSATEYTEEIGGDGFEVIWHSTDPDQMIGGSQLNGLERSSDGGATFVPATFGLEDDGPFITRLSNSTIDPDLLFAIGASGVYRSSDFGRNWTYSRIEDDRWSFWSAADVEVSLADPAIVWAGGGMVVDEDDSFNMFVSQDGGFSFNATNNFGDVGLSTGTYSHPFDRNTAYVLFGVADGPKILKTTDLGQTWTDITQFENGESQNGFPDVATYSLLVMPHDTNMIWAGTEIGIVESLDGGETWSMINASDFRAVGVWDMKVKGDQVVLATFGRGVWSATIPELVDAPTPEVVLGPVLSQLGQSTEEFSMVINYDLRDQYDQVVIYFNDQIELTLPGNTETGPTSTTIPLIDVGDYLVRIEAIKGDLSFRTAELDIIISPFFPTSDEYANDFEEPTEDFTLSRFTIGGAAGISSNVLQTVHPYPEGDELGVQSVNLTAKLNIPIRIAEADATIRFREIVIVEIGEPGTSFGDEEFWDYVVVEGSLDGANWVPFADGYDSSADPAWEAAYLGGANGSDTHFRNRTINMLDKFNAGDVVQIRFRLFSDPFANAWGWAIDDLLIQAAPPVVSGINAPEIERAVSIFPNPSFGTVNLSIENVLHGDIRMRVIDYAGKQLLSRSLNNQSGILEQRIDLSLLPFGLYVIELNNGRDVVTKKVLKF